MYETIRPVQRKGDAFQISPFFSLKAGGFLLGLQYGFAHQDDPR